MKYQRSSASLIGALFLIAGSLCAQASPATAEKIIQEGQTRSQVMRHLNTLTNRIGPRLTSSDNLIEACNWAVETFKGFGIENARLYEWGTYPVGFNRGTMIGRMVSPKTMKLDLTTPSWTAGTAGLTRGRVVAFPEPESATGDRSAPGDGGAKGGRGTEDAPDATAQPMDLKGAWVLFPRMTRGRRPAISTDELKKAGALGSIYPSYGQTNDLVLTGGSSRISWDDLPDFPTIMLRRDQISEINAELDKGEEVILEFDIENEFKEGPIPVYNVIADIVGTEFPDEYVIVGGHIDSWDGATGTTDNGTGSATTIEAARLLMAAGAKPKRTIRFMLWSGEEQGLLGSRAWIKDNMDQMEKISAVLVHDGGTNYVSGIIATPTMKEDFERVFAPCIGLNADLPFEISERDGLPGGIGSDHDAFLSEGVPGFFWRQSGRANYTYTHHTQFDTFDAAIPEYQQHTSMVVAIGALGIANLDHMLNRENLRAASTRNRRRLGINVDDDMKLNSVLEDSVAGKAGLKVGDKLISVGKIEIKDLGDLRRAINVDDQKLKVIYEREGKRHEAEAVFPASPTRR